MLLTLLANLVQIGEPTPPIPVVTGGRGGHWKDVNLDIVDDEEKKKREEQNNLVIAICKAYIENNA